MRAKNARHASGRTRRHADRLCASRPTPLCLFPQVGANDHSGNSNGKDYGLLATSSGWNSLLIEPMPSAYDRLVERYRTASRVRLKNAAVCDSCTSQAQVRLPPT